MTLRFLPKLMRVLAASLIAVGATMAMAQDQGEQPTPKQKVERKNAQKGEAKAEQKGVPSIEQDRIAAQGALRLLPPDSVTRHSITTASGKLDYTATAGTLALYDQSGDRIAAVFYTSYVLDPRPDTSRPVTFVFNGGPGASSAYLHLGVAGPRVAEFGPGNRDAASTRLHDNPDTWLQFTDLVMIDPVGSGFSRSSRADGNSAFWSVARDVESLSKVITLWLAHNQRSDSPKFILGESYGGFRAAKVANALRRDHGVATNGIVMVSPLMEGNFTFAGTRFALGAAMQIPSLAAAELQRRDLFTPERLAEAEHFAFNEYLTTLVGPPPRGEAAQAFYTRLAELTGLPLSVVTRTRGFIRDNFVKSLRGAEGMIVSRYDVTFATPDPSPESASARGSDPLLDGMSRYYGGAMSTYVRDELGFKTEMSYVLLSGEANGRWDWGRGSGRDGASVENDLRELLSLDPSFRLLVAHGYTDLVTPYSVSRYVLNHLPDFPNPERTQLKVYRGGHMFYIDIGSRRDFTADARSFYEAEP